MTKRGTALVFIANAALLVAGCRQLVGIDDQPAFHGASAAGSGGGAATCEAPAFTGGACQACVAASCCAEASKCADDAACASYAACLGACPAGGDACESDCRASNAAGDGATAAALRSCQGKACSATCGLTCGGYVYGGDSCATCSREKCCAEAGACATNPDCAALAACERQCPVHADSCLRLCELTYPAGVVEERALGDCTTSKCPTSCFPQQWECLTHLVTPLAKPITVSLVLGDFVSGNPVVGAAVRVCANTDRDCSAGIQEPSTDDAGKVSVPMMDTSNHYIEIVGDGDVPVLLFLPPLASDVEVGFPVPTEAAFIQAADAIAGPGMFNPSLGSVIAVAKDCDGASAAGVALTIAPSAGTIPFYFVDEYPSNVPKVTDAAYGAGGFLDVQTVAGVTVSGTVVTYSLPLPPLSLFTRPGALSLGVLYANPQ